MRGTATFLAARTDRVDVGLAALAVLRVLPRADWSGADPADLEEMLDGAPPREACRHVLLVTTPQGAVPIGTARALVVREVASDDLHDLPPLVHRPGAAPLLASVAQPADAVPLLVLDPVALAARAAAEPSRGGEA